ncbi:MAG: hypothetical protein GY870_09875 [archaeon]|nr:hypothetical protein [archaeon]
MKIGLINGVNLSTQHIIVRADNWNSKYRLPKLGTTIVDSNLKPCGFVSDIFGPVFKPFFSIKPTRSTSLSSFASLVGEPLYTESKKNLANKRNQMKYMERRKGKKSTKRSTKRTRNFEKKHGK